MAARTHPGDLGGETEKWEERRVEEAAAMNQRSNGLNLGEAGPVYS